MARSPSRLVDPRGSLHSSNIGAGNRELSELTRLYSVLETLTHSEKQQTATFIKMGEYLKRVKSGQDNLNELNDKIGAFFRSQDKAILLNRHTNREILNTIAKMSLVMQDFLATQGRTYVPYGSASGKSWGAKRQLAMMREMELSHADGVGARAQQMSSKFETRGHEPLITQIGAKFIKGKEEEATKAPEDMDAGEGESGKKLGVKIALAVASVVKKLIQGTLKAFTDLGRDLTSNLGFLGDILSGALGMLTLDLKEMLSSPLKLIAEFVKKIVKSSAALGGVLELLDLVFTIFFLPIGNLLANALLPTIIKMLDVVVGSIDLLKDLNDISEYFNRVFHPIMKGVMEGIMPLLFNILLQMLPHIFKTIRDVLTDPTVQKGLEDLFVAAMRLAIPLILEGILTILKMFFDMKKGQVAGGALAGAAGGMVAGAIIGSVVPGVGTVVGAVVGGLIGAVAGGFGGLMMADGGYVPSTPGGSLRILGEGGQGEWVVPESDMDRLLHPSSGGLVINFNAPVYGVDDLERKIESAIDRKNNASRFR